LIDIHLTVEISGLGAKTKCRNNELEASNHRCHNHAIMACDPEMFRSGFTSYQKMSETSMVIDQQDKNSNNIP